MPFWTRKSKPKGEDSHKRHISRVKNLLSLFKRNKGDLNEAAKQRTTLPPLSEPTKCFRVRVRIAFMTPVCTVVEQDYETSDKFVATDRTWGALMNNFKHHSTELIKRPDSSAMEPTKKCGRKDKPQRYSIYVLIDRNECRWTEQTFTSYQKMPMTVKQAEYVLAELQHIVAQFLGHHDPGFTHPGAVARKPHNPSPATACIPDSINLNNEARPGYQIEMGIRSQVPNTTLNASSTIQSLQRTPLTIPLGEDLMHFCAGILQATALNTQRGVETKKKKDATSTLELLVKIRNNLGPSLPNLSFVIEGDQFPFHHPDTSTFDAFTTRIKSHLEMLRDRSDDKVNSLDDFVLKLTQLRGEDWEVTDLITIFLDASILYGRRVIDTILSRVQAGIQKTLKGTGLRLTMTAVKKGHLLLQETVGRRGPTYTGHEHVLEDISTAKALQEQLGEVVRAEITTICKDTCSFEAHDQLPNLVVIAHDLTYSPENDDDVSSHSRPSTIVELDETEPAALYAHEMPSSLHLESLFDTPTPAVSLNLSTTKQSDVHEDEAASSLHLDSLFDMPASVASSNPPETTQINPSTDEAASSPHLDSLFATPAPGTPVVTEETKPSENDEDDTLEPMNLDLLFSETDATVAPTVPTKSIARKQLKKDPLPAATEHRWSSADIMEEYGYLAGHIQPDDDVDDSRQISLSGSLSSLGGSEHHDRSSSSPISAAGPREKNIFSSIHVKKNSTSELSHTSEETIRVDAAHFASKTFSFGDSTNFDPDCVFRAGSLVSAAQAEKRVIIPAKGARKAAHDEEELFDAKFADSLTDSRVSFSPLKFTFTANTSTNTFPFNTKKASTEAATPSRGEMTSAGVMNDLPRSKGSHKKQSAKSSPIVETTNNNTVGSHGTNLRHKLAKEPVDESQVLLDSKNNSFELYAALITYLRATDPDPVMGSFRPNPDLAKREVFLHNKKKSPAIAV